MPRSFTVLAGVLLLAVGIALVAGGGLPRAGSVAPIALPSPTASATPGPTASAGATSVAPTPAATIGPIPDGYRVLVPRLGIDLPIAEGDVERDVVVQKTPENFAFHFPGTAIPGTLGNSYLYAHARQGMFLSLWNARVGDQVSITTPAGSALKFVITEVHPRVPPADTSWLQPTSDERLTLQTSTGPNSGDPRFVVVAAPD
ncbi:MAG TPA: sortase [Candidatus Polarisedimenticolia bacterium]|nr:sortase [Candidatus Polarisedimenticolia bacterium]